MCLIISGLSTMPLVSRGSAWLLLALAVGDAPWQLLLGCPTGTILTEDTADMAHDFP